MLVPPDALPAGATPLSARADSTRADLVRAAHDVNNALNSVLVASHLLQLSASDPDAVRRHADRIAQAAREGVAAAARTSAILRADVARADISAPHS